MENVEEVELKKRLILNPKNLMHILKPFFGVLLMSFKVF